MFEEGQKGIKLKYQLHFLNFLFYVQSGEKIEEGPLPPPLWIVRVGVPTLSAALFFFLLLRALDS